VRGNMRLSRRQAFFAGARWLILPACTSVSLAPEWAFGAKAAKADYSYREQPKEGKSCAGCRLFSLTESGKGVCAIVDGDISPSGWCLAFSPRT
jgi:hypothetical protein